MTHFFKNRGSLFIIIVLMFPMVFCKPNRRNFLPAAEDSKKLDQFLADLYNAYPLPGLAVGIVTEHGSYFKSLGYNDLKQKLPLTDSTLLFMGEFSELLVATAILKLQEEAKLWVEDNVMKHLPYFKMQGAFDQVKIHNLLTHTSGIPHFNPAWDMPNYNADALEATTRSIVFQPLAFIPNRKRLRSPYNYDIAADLIEKTGKSTFEDVMETLVLKPLKMTNSTYSFTGLSEEQYAKPYQIEDWLSYSLGRAEPYPYTRENAGSFGLHATIPDMMNWMKMALRIEKGMLSTESVNELLQEHYKFREGNSKGYGWEIVTTAEDIVYNNHWSAGGFSGDMSLFPGKGFGIIVMANTGGDFNPTIVSERVAHFIMGNKLEQVKLPAHIEMSRQLANGNTLPVVLQWYDSLTALKKIPYQLSPSILSQLGVNLLHRLHRKEDAVAVFRHCVKLYPDASEAYLNLAEGLLNMDCLAEAREQFKIALNLNPRMNTPYVHFLREQILVSEENAAPL